MDPHILFGDCIKAPFTRYRFAWIIGNKNSVYTNALIERLHVCGPDALVTPTYYYVISSHDMTGANLF